MKNILLVDDSLTARLFMRQCLEIAGCQGADFREAADGRDALEQMRTARFDCVMVDLNMPVMDGATLLKKIKASPKWCATPVVIISSASNPAAEARLLAAGASAVLSKPITPAMIAASMGGIINSKEADDAVLQQ